MSLLASRMVVDICCYVKDSIANLDMSGCQGVSTRWRNKPPLAVGFMCFFSTNFITCLKLRCLRVSMFGFFHIFTQSSHILTDLVNGCKGNIIYRNNNITPRIAVNWPLTSYQYLHVLPHKNGSCIIPITS